MSTVSALALALVAALVLPACGSSSDNNANSSTTNNANSQTNNSTVPSTIVKSASFTNVDGTPSATGMISVREDGGKTYLYLESDFMAEMGPGDTELRLAKADTNLADQMTADASSVTDAIGTIGNAASGPLLFEVPSSVNVDDFAYAVVWCPTAALNFAVADLGGSGGDLASYSGTLTNVDGTPSATGTVTITELTAGHFSLAFGSDFMAEMGPGDTEVRLAKADTNVAEQLDADATSVSDAIGTIGNGATGAQEIEFDVDPADFGYVIVWCPTAALNFAVAMYTPTN